MDPVRRRFLHRIPLVIAPILVALLLPAGALSAEECGAWPGEPMVLRDQRIPFYEVFETFLVHASVVHDSQGQQAYSDFLRAYGLDPELRTLQDLPWAFDGLQSSLRLHEGESEHETAERAGAILASVFADILKNDPRGDAAIRELRLRLGTQLRPAMSLIFVEGVPNFAILDEADERFYGALEAAGQAPFLRHAEHDAETLGEGGLPASTPGARAAIRVKLSFLGEDETRLQLGKDLQPTGLAKVEWRRYARADGSTRVVGAVDSGVAPLSLVDITYPPGERLRDVFEHGGTGGVHRFVEYIPFDPSLPGKSHTSLACIAASIAAGAACAACALPPDPITCAACAAALIAVAAACNQPHCNQIQCNASCVQACHLYGWCSSTSGSSTPADCQCFGLDPSAPGCGGGGGGGCAVVASSVAVLDLAGGDPIRVSTGPFMLDRLETSDEIHGGERVSFLMGEWAVLAQDPAAAVAGSALSVRAVRSSPGFAALQAPQLQAALAAAGGPFAKVGRTTIVVATPPHDANSREIPMPALRVASAGLPAGGVSGKIAIRADFSESGELSFVEILADTLGGVSSQLAAAIEQALSLEHFSEKRHRVVAFAVLSVGESLEMDSELLYLPKCCCGSQFCI